MGESMGFDQEDEAVRRLLKRNEEFLDWVWNKGAFGKVAIALYLLTSVSPSVFNGYAILLLWFRFYPMANTLTEQLEVLGILVALANAEVLSIRWFLTQVMLQSYVTRRRRRKKATTQTELSS